MAAKQLTVRLNKALGGSGEGVYAGPRPFRTGQRLYGRDRETAEVLSLIISQRLLLLHSPSGAGKTSLIQAKLVPAMLKRRFEVAMAATIDDESPQPIVVRLNRIPEANDPPGANRYLLSALLSLESHRPVDRRRSVDALALLNVETYLNEEFPAACREFVSGAGEADSFRPLLLLIDQFEELVSLDPTDQAAKLEFVQQLGHALLNPGRWALFSIREDFLGALEPYVEFLPTRLAARYRLDLLSADIAPTVIEEPARAAGVDFEPSVVRQLVDDLRQVRLQAADGSFRYTAGHYVEPVHLQVVCQSLWRIKGDAETITEAHLQQLGGGKGTGVDDVLASYYATCAAVAASEGSADERLVRDWFGGQLIGDQRVRRPTLLNEALDFGLTTDALRVLDKALLIRRENRGGAMWYELAHDRLIEPVLKNNQSWRQQHLSRFQLQAELWAERGRPDDLLLSGAALEQSEVTSAVAAARLTPTEREFLDASKRRHNELRLAEERIAQHRHIRRMRVALLLGGTIVSVLVVFSALTTYLALRAMRAEWLASWHAYAGDLSEVQRNLAHANFRGTEVALSAVNQELRGWELDYLRSSHLQDQRTYSGHRASVLSVAVSPSGEWFASTGVDKTIRFWDVQKREVLRKVDADDDGQAGHSDWITDLAISHDGEWMISASDDQTVRRWNLGTPDSNGSPVMTADQSLKLTAHQDSVTCVAISPDDQWFVSGSQDQTLIIWDAITGKTIRSLEPGDDSVVTCVAISPDGRYILCGCKNAKLYLWDADTGELRTTLSGHAGPVTGVSFSLDESRSRCLSCSEDATVREWDFEGGQQTGVLTDFQDAVECAIYRGDGQRILCGCRNGEVKEYEYDTSTTDWNPELGFMAHNVVVRCLGYLPDHRFLTGSVDCSIKVWNGPPLPASPPIKGHQDAIWAVAVAPNGRLYTASEDTTVRIWDLDTGHSIDTLRGHDDGVWCVAVSPNGNLLASGGMDSSVRIWDVRDVQNAGTGTKLGSGHQDAVAGVAFSLDGKWLFSGSYDKTLKVWDVVGRKLQNTLVVDHRLTSVRVSPDGEWLGAGTKNDVILIWSTARATSEGTAANRPDFELEGHQGRVASVAFSPDSQHLVSAGDDTTVRIWDFRRQVQLSKLAGHTAWVTDVTYSPDGTRIASASQDNTAKIWNAEVGVSLLTLPGHFDSIWGAKFSADGQKLITVSEDWTMRIWDARIDAVQE